MRRDRASSFRSQPANWTPCRTPCRWYDPRRRETTSAVEIGPDPRRGSRHDRVDRSLRSPSAAPPPVLPDPSGAPRGRPVEARRPVRPGRAPLRTTHGADGANRDGGRVFYRGSRRRYRNRTARQSADVAAGRRTADSLGRADSRRAEPLRGNRLSRVAGAVRLGPNVVRRRRLPEFHGRAPYAGCHRTDNAARRRTAALARRQGPSLASADFKLTCVSTPRDS